MRDWEVLVCPGDGIGPEVLGAAAPVVEVAGAALREVTGRGIRTRTALVGGAAIDAEGVPLSPETLAEARACDAILFGAVGGPRWDGLPPERRPERAILDLRSELGLFANLREARAWPELLAQSPLRPEAVSGTDCLIVRENTGGLYYGPRERRTTPEGRLQAIDTMVYDEDQIRRVALLAFRAAKRRRRSVVSVDKANVLENSRLWRQVVDEVASGFPDVSCSHLLVDAAAMAIVARPADFDVIVTANLFGDILSDLLGGVVGTLGVLASANIGEGRRGLYEPVHGSAPDIAGQDRANPIGAILSFAVLCEHSLGAGWLAQAIREAVDESVGAVLALGTRAAGEAVARSLAGRLSDPGRVLVDVYNHVAAES